MATHQIPRNVKGEGRFLVIFSTKSLLFSLAFAAVGLLATSFMALGIPRIIIVLVIGAIGFGIATLKVPDSNALEVTRKVGGESLDEIILRYFKFKMKKHRIYLYTKEELK